MTGKVNPHSNDEARRIASEHVKKQEAQRVKELEAIDPDQRAKQQQFKNLMQPSDDENDDTPAINPSAPSPLQPSFYKNSTTNSGIDPKLAIPSPAYSPAPNVNEVSDDMAGLFQDDSYSGSGLPEAPEYYQTSDYPMEPTDSLDFQEDASTQVQIPGQSPTQTSQTTKNDRLDPLANISGKDRSKGDHLANQINRGPAAVAQKGKALDANPFGLTGKPTTPKAFDAHATAKKEAGQKKAGEETTQPTSKFWNEEKIQKAPLTPFSARTESEKKLTGTAKTGAIETRVDDKKMQAKPLDPVSESTKDQPAHEESKSKGRESKKESSDNTAPSQTNTVAPQFQGSSDASAVAPAPYITRPEAILFCQTVGTIIVNKMTNGISSTQFVLNNPRFANSRFAGATIEVIRHQHAGGELSIRISGSPEAVSAFNQSKDSLMATFQNGYNSGEFKFQIARIDVEHKPVFHRREKGGDQGSSDQEGKNR